MPNRKDQMAKRNAVSAKGARLLRKVAAHILEEPERYNQNATIERGEPGSLCYPWDRGGGHYPACGTIACIGGWLTILTSKREVEGMASFRRLSWALGVPEAQAERLFAYVGDTECDEGWPIKFAQAYNNAKTARQRARVAVRRIEHFIKTGE
jgi:hypothetical protein